MNKEIGIAIIGSGISGLALSIALRQKGFSNVCVYEKDASFDSRRQGYGLTILQGKSALRSLGVLEQAKQCNSPSKAHYIFDKNGFLLGFYGTLFWDNITNNRSLRSAEKGLSMHIPRQQLRKVLLNRYNSLFNKPINWNHSLKSLKLCQKTISMNFTNGQRQSCDLLVACDGIYSSVKSQLVQNAKGLRYLGVIIVLGLCPNSHSLNKNRVFQTIDGKYRLFSMPFSKQNPQLGSMWQLSFKLDEDTAKGYLNNVDQLKIFLKEQLKNWHSPIPQMIQQTKLENIMAIPAYDREAEYEAIKDGRILLTGDALHPMSPFKGQGANQALIDSIEAAEFLEKQESISQLSPALEILMKKLLHRAGKKVQLSRQRVQKYHSSSFLNPSNFIYPKIDLNLIGLLKSNNISSSTGDNLEQQIKQMMKKHKYVL